MKAKQKVVQAKQKAVKPKQPVKAKQKADTGRGCFDDRLTSAMVHRGTRGEMHCLRERKAAGTQTQRQREHSAKAAGTLRKGNVLCLTGFGAAAIGTRFAAAPRRRHGLVSEEKAVSAQAKGSGNTSEENPVKAHAKGSQRTSERQQNTSKMPCLYLTGGGGNGGGGGGGGWL